MSEYTSSRYFSDKQQRQEAILIANEATACVDRMYGRGYPVGGRGEHELSYHNGHHARKVGEGALKICTHLGLSPVEQAVAEAAGKAHDIVQLKGRGTDEKESADWLMERMERSGLFPAGLRQMATLAILGTEPLFKNGAIVGQRAEQQEYPTKNAELVAKSVASADLGVLYTPEGPYLSHQLFREVSGMPPEHTLPFDKLIAFQRGTLKLAEHYTYPLAEAERLLATHRPEVTAFHQELLAKLEAGDITSWPELMRHDQAFIEKHRA